MLVLLYRVDPEQTPIFPPCLFRWLTGLYCPGCGGTRCVHALLHGELGQALAYNALVCLLVPLAILWGLWRLLASQRKLPGWCLFGVFAAVAGFGIVRNLPFTPFTQLAPHRVAAK
jgi:hypothetical protein